MAREDVTMNGHLTHWDSLQIDQLVWVTAVVADRTPLPDVGALGGARLENMDGKIGVPAFPKE